jgi:hypothetical protein
LVNQDADAELIAMLQGVVQRGTGTAVAAVGKPLAGKTGTTSDWYDAWFVGFSPDLAAGVYVGFDDPRTLGTGEVGGHVAAPIFRDFMAQALKNVPAKAFPEPPSAAVAVNTIRGRSAASDDDEDAATTMSDAPASDTLRPWYDDRANADREPTARDYQPTMRGYGAPAYGAPGYAAPGYTTRGYGTPGYGTPYRDYGQYPRDYGAPYQRDYAPYPREFGGSSTPPARGYVPARVLRPGGGTGGLY